VHYDNLLPIGEQNGSTIGVDAGLEFKWKESRIGFSVLDVNEPVSDWNGVNRTWSPTYLAHASSMLAVAELIELELNAIAQLGRGPMQAAVNLTAWYDNNIGVGSALRSYSGTTLDAVSLLVGWRPTEKITLAYAYDFGLSALSRSHDGSHEVVFRYVMQEPIGRGKLPPVIFNPRL
jgi:hypothetical protein